MRRPKELAGCYIYPENGRKFIQVAVMHTRADLGLLAKHFKIRGYSRLGGFCAYVPKHKRGKSNCIAVVGLCKNGIGTKVVAHEMTHAALMYLGEENDLPQDPLRSANERLCYLVGECTSAFYVWAKAKELF